MMYSAPKGGMICFLESSVCGKECQREEKVPREAIYLSLHKRRASEETQ
jgi:hypothetical protein